MKANRGVHAASKIGAFSLAIVVIGRLLGVKKSCLVLWDKLVKEHGDEVGKQWRKGTRRGEVVRLVESWQS